jgi:phage terminase small subunit
MELPANFDFGPKMLALSERERAFVWCYVSGDDGKPISATEAARRAGYVDGGAGTGIRVTAHHLMHRERVIEGIEEFGRRAFRALLVPAINANRKLIENPKHPDHHKAVQATLSRLGLAEKVGVDVNVSGEVSVNHTDAAVADLRVLLGLGVPREKLLELFGFSGLARYEKMLGEQERRALPAPPVIEHEEKVG